MPERAKRSLLEFSLLFLRINDPWSWRLSRLSKELVNNRKGVPRDGAKRFHESLFVEVVEAWRTPFNTATRARASLSILRQTKLHLDNGVVPDGVMDEVALAIPRKEVRCGGLDELAPLLTVLAAQLEWSRALSTVTSRL